MFKDFFGDVYEEFMNNKFIVVSGIIFVDGFGIVNDKVEEILKIVYIIVNLVVIIIFDER